MEGRVKEIKLLIGRLERLSVDSVLAHRASGLRGSLLHCLEELEGNCLGKTNDKTDYLIDQGYGILELAAKKYLSNRRIDLARVPKDIGRNISDLSSG